MHVIRYWLVVLIVLSFLHPLRSQSVGGNTSGSAAFCTSANSGFLSLSGYTGTIQHWESSVNSGLSWTHIQNPTSTQNYNNLSQTTWYRVIVRDGTFPPDTSTVSVITIYQKAIAGTVTGGGAFCLTAPAGVLYVNGTVGQVAFWQSSVNAGSSWSVMSSTLSSLPHPSLSQSTLFRVVVSNVAGCPADTSLPASFLISQNTVPGIVQKSDTVCSGVNADTLRVSGQLGAIVAWIVSSNGAGWSPLANATSAQTYSKITQTAAYAVVVKNGACPADTTDPVHIIVVNANVANAGADQSIIQYESVQLHGNGYGTPEWMPDVALSDHNLFDPVASPLHTITYVLTLTDSHGCMSTDSMVVKVIIPVPTAITPNGDGVNDYFLVDKIEEYPGSSLFIFNRWGNVVYKEAPYKNMWNGKSSNGHDLPDEIYYYTLDYGNGEAAVSGYILIKR